MSKKANIELRQTVTRIFNNGLQFLFLLLIIANNTLNLNIFNKNIKKKRFLSVNQNKLSFNSKKLQLQKFKKL